ncbi:MAG TPA: TIGR02281 family clan AA aspartic protease [Burkholderiales bacterium]|jgi:aspartyl protease family protein
MRRHFISLCVLLACCAAAAAAPSAAHSAELALIGVIGTNAAVIAIDGGEPHTIKVGQTRSGVTLVSVEHERATVEFEGKKRILALGQHYRSASAPGSTNSGQTVTLAADPRGHFLTEGSINGMPMRFLVDTGATTIALPASDAVRLGIDYRKGKQGISRTAGGMVPFYVVTLDRVRLGDLELTNVEAAVIEQGLDIALLGMSFLNRVDIRQEGRTMTLIKRF